MTPESTPTRSSTATVMTTVGGVVAALALVAGAFLLIVHLTQRDDSDHYYRTGNAALVSPGHAVTSEGVGIDDIDTELANGLIEDLVGDVRIQAPSRGSAPLFVGIGPKPAVDAYLDGVARTQITDVDDDGVETRERPGGAPASPPAAQSFWTESAQTTTST